MNTKGALEAQECMPHQECTVDVSAMENSSPAGRLKENVCGDRALRETAMSASSLSAMSFELPPGFQNVSKEKNKNFDMPDAMYLSSSSSTCTRESDPGTLSDFDSSNLSGHNRLPPTPLDRGVSDKLNAKISLRKTSRQGRSSQRWVTNSNETIRLVTGCVPILKGGKIMFVSASRKPEWILPKGGWELDETIEESAIRECFEEAGVLGILGPTLKEVEYETRKAKKRRLEKEKEQSKRHVKAKTQASGSSNFKNDGGTAVVTDTVLVNERRIREKEETCGNTSEETTIETPSTYCKVRMTLFPLYVSQVLEKWPEDGRFRKAVDIDEAIAMMSNRPEFKAVLEEVKSRGLHLLSQPIRDIVPPFE